MFQALHFILSSMLQVSSFIRSFMFQASRFKIHFLFFIFVVISVFPHIAGAQSVNITAPSASYEAGNTFIVSVSLNTAGKSINTVSGTIDIPSDKIQMQDLRYGNSIITLWVEKPAYNASNGTISFTGGVPGGYAGSNGPILSFTARAKTAGPAVISILEAKILLNDGQGTEVTASKGAFTVTVTPATVKPKTETPKQEIKQEASETPKDETAPEPFLPVVARDESIAEGKLFISFNAVDKDTGVAYYEVEERPWLISGIISYFNAPWDRAEPPYVLRRQWWPGKVIVRAIDQAGNTREAVVETPFQTGFAFALFIFALALGGGLMYWLGKQKRPKKRLV